MGVKSGRAQAESDCGCVEDDECKEKYIEAYQCYLENKNDLGKCLEQIKLLKNCYTKRERGRLDRLRAIFRGFWRSS